jgi:hypothetical protein
MEKMAIGFIKSRNREVLQEKNSYYETILFFSLTTTRRGANIVMQWPFVPTIPG